MQVRGIGYAIRGDDNELISITQDHNYVFWNPKAGINFQPDSRQRIYVSFAVANREPNRDNFVDADPNHPVPRPETLFDYEAGYNINASWLRAGANLYFMNYRNQLVLTGEINDVGSAVMTNVDHSYRAGIELYNRIEIRKELLLGRQPYPQQE